MGSRDEKVYTEAYASVRFYHDELDPALVTKALCLPPDVAFRKGDENLVRGKTGRVLRRSPRLTSMWSMCSKNWVNSPKLETHILWLVEQLEPIAEQVRELTRDCKSDIFCYSLGRTSTPPTLSKALRMRCSALGLKIEIDHYSHKDV